MGLLGRSCSLSLWRSRAPQRVLSEIMRRGTTSLSRDLSASRDSCLPASDLERLASMPTREQAISLLMATMQAPVTKLAMTLKEVPGKLVRTIEAVRQHKEAA